MSLLDGLIYGVRDIFSNGVVQPRTSALNFVGATVTFNGGTGAIDVTLSGGSPQGAAGGDLATTYPNPTVAQLTGVAGVVTLIAATLSWSAATVTPRLKQADNTTNSAVATTLTVQAANATGTTATGGTLALTSGTGTTVAGNVELQTGGTAQLRATPTALVSVQDNPLQFGTGTLPAVGSVRFPAGSRNLLAIKNSGAADTVLASWSPDTLIIGADTTVTASQVSSIKYSVGSGGHHFWVVGSATQIDLNATGGINFTFFPTTSAPSINQTTIATNSATGQTMTIAAQTASGTTSVGGQLVLSSGNGTTKAGDLLLQSGGTTQLQIDVTNTKVTLANYSLVLAAASTFVSIGTNVPTAGDLRLPKGFTLNTLTSSAVTQNVVSHSAANNGVTFGDATNGSMIYQTAGTHSLRVGGTDRTIFSSTEQQNNVPIVGMSAGNAPWGVHGMVTVTPGSDANYSLLNTEYKYSAIKLVLTNWVTDHTITLPAATDANGYWKWIWNTSATRTATISAGGTTFTLAPTLSQFVFIDNTGARKMTPTQVP